jgi:hypothetical protein
VHPARNEVEPFTDYGIDVHFWSAVTSRRFWKALTSQRTPYASFPDRSNIRTGLTKRVRGSAAQNRER